MKPKLEVNSKLKQKFDSIQSALMDGRIHNILATAAIPVIQDAKARSLPISKSISSSIGVIKKGNYPLHALIGPRYPQGNLAHIFEYGTKPRYTKDGSYRGQITAKPFMRPAIDSNIESVERKAKLMIKEEIKKLTDK